MRSSGRPLFRSASLAAFCCASALTKGAGAEPSSERTLTVERDPGTETCPDADALSAQVEALRGREPPPPLPFRVRFARSATSFSARIEGETGTRLLSSRGSDCDGLARATAVTLTLLVDAELSGEPEAPEPPAPATSEPAPTAPPPRPSAKVVAAPVRGSLALGASALFGEIANVAPAVAADAGLHVGRLHAGLGALVSFPRHLELGPGQVRVQLLLLDARLCVTAVRTSERLEFELCSGAWIGVATASPKGYVTNRSAREPWLGLPFELGLLGRVTPRFYVEASSGLLIPITRREFAIDGLGAAYDAPPVAGFAGLRIGFFI